MVNAFTKEDVLAIIDEELENCYKQADVAPIGPIYDDNGNISPYSSEDLRRISFKEDFLVSDFLKDFLFENESFREIIKERLRANF